MNTTSNLYREESIKVIETIFRRKLNTDHIITASLMKGGMFNTTYKVKDQDGKLYALRIGPINRQLLLDFEHHLMKAESCVYSLCKEFKIPCPEILVCDTDKAFLDRDYMVMEYIQGSSLSALSLPSDVKKRLYRQVGAAACRLHSITGPSFGRVSHTCSGKQFRTWHQFFLFEMEDILNKLSSYQVFSPTEESRIRSYYESKQDLLQEITVPHLIHSDLWDGNILVTGKDETWELAALIDADRAVWGDPDFDLATPWINDPAFYVGYAENMEDFNSEKRKNRRYFYHLHFCMVDIYVNLAEYNNIAQYQKLKEELLEGINT